LGQHRLSSPDPSDWPAVPLKRHVTPHHERPERAVPPCPEQLRHATQSSQSTPDHPRGDPLRPHPARVREEWFRPAELRVLVLHREHQQAKPHRWVADVPVATARAAPTDSPTTQSFYPPVHAAGGPGARRRQGSRALERTSRHTGRSRRNAAGSRRSTELIVHAGIRFPARSPPLPGFLPPPERDATSRDANLRARAPDAAHDGAAPQTRERCAERRACRHARARCVPVIAGAGR
jgi:hypothetical protein